MKKLQAFAVIGLLGFMFLVGNYSTTVNASVNVEAMCDEACISYNLVQTVAKYSNYSEEELVSIFSEYAQLTGTEDEVDVVDAIAEVVGCDIDTALEIITESDNM
jgi:hypothetical protein